MSISSVSKQIRIQLVKKGLSIRALADAIGVKRQLLYEKLNTVKQIEVLERALTYLKELK